MAMQLQEPGQESPRRPLRGTEQRSYQAISPGLPAAGVEISPIVTPLRYCHIAKASKTWVGAFEKDPVLRYVDNNRKQTPDVKRSTRFAMFCVMVHWKSRKISLTVDGGASVLFCTAPRLNYSPLEDCMSWLLKQIGKLFATLSPREERKRATEVREKVEAAVSRSLGDRVKGMLYIDTLATEPVSQGWGYGGALLDAVGALGDLTGREIWLQSTNEQNTEFYISHGYVMVDEAVVGNDNPTWHGAPILIKIMVRAPRVA